MTRDSADDPLRSRGDDELDAERHQEIARCLFRESSDALFLFDPESHRVLDLNPAAIRLSGFTKEQARALRLYDLFSGESPALLDCVVDAYRRTGFYHSREGFTLARKCGSPIPVNVSVSRIHIPPTPIGLVIARDVTERKRVENALRDSEARYRGLIETAKVVFWTVSINGRIRALNPQFSAVTGWTADAWTERPLTDLIHADDRATAEAFIASAKGGDLPRPIELRVSTRGGSACVMEFLPTAIADENGEFVLSGIARDMTEARLVAQAYKHAEKLESARRAAEAADQAKSEFLAQFSHEIRTPLTAILGFTDVLLGDEDVAKLPEERLTDLKIIERNGAHLLTIINDILDLSQVEAGKLPIHLAPCSPQRVIGDVIASLSVRAETKGLRFKSESGSSTPETITTDVVRFRQIIMNLAANAIKYTERGGITLRSAGITHDGRTALAIDVQDTGVGINSDTLAHLFEPFYRAAAAPEVGTGLGLAISRRLAQTLGGRITVSSEPGRGSTFRLILPTNSESTKAAIPTHDEPSTISNGKHIAERIDAHILIAEDNTALQRVTTLQLEKLGASVEIARNGQEAVEAAISAREKGRDYDVILMDMQMPVLDGYEATRQLRATGFRGAIIALTAYAMADDRQECLGLGCDEHLTKPIDWGRLASVIAKQVRLRSQLATSGIAAPEIPPTS